MTILRFVSAVVTFIIVMWMEVEFLMHYLGDYLLSQDRGVRVLAVGACVIVAWLVGAVVADSWKQGRGK